MQTTGMGKSLYDRLKDMGIGKGYASQIANGKRNPSLALAIRIYKQTGAKVGPVQGLTPSEIKLMERASVKRLATVP